MQHIPLCCFYIEMDVKKAGTVTVLAAIILIGLFFRLVSIRTYSPNPDEFHWIFRSEKLNELYSTGQISRLTNHLGHPGIPAAVAMAIAERLGDSWNELVGAQRGSRSYIDHLTAARLSNVLWFVLLIPLMFTSLRRAIGDEAALLAAALVSFDTQHIANTRIAHIDGALTTLVLCCLTIYMEAQARRSLYLKILSGIAWGLCLAVKPTAISLIPGFILANALWRFSAAKSGDKTSAPPIVGWSDVLAGVVGILTLASMHTRFWAPYSKFLRIHHINPIVCDWIVAISEVMHETPLILPISAFVFLGWAAYCVKRTPSSKGFSNNFCAVVFGIALVVTMVGFFPTITSNIIRYCYWVMGLSHMQHIAYGGTPIEPPTGGYTRIWLSRTTPWMALGFVAATIWSVIGLWSRDRWRWLADHREVLSYIIIVLIWTAFLSVSSKQAFRYTLPMVPLIAGFAAFGFIESWRRLVRNPKIASNALVPLILGLPQLIPTVIISPDFGLYFSWDTGGVKGAMSAGASIQPVQYEKAFEAIEQIAQKEKRTQVVEVAGDFDLLRASYNRDYLPGQRHLTIVSYQDGLGSDWVINFPYFTAHKVEDFNRMGNLQLESEFIYDGGTIYQLYHVNALPKGKEIRIDISDTARSTGSTYHDPVTDMSGLELDADEHKRGFGVFGLYLKLPAGKATFKITAAIHERHSEDNEPLLKIALAKRCEKAIYPADFGSPIVLGEFKTFEVSCDFDKTSRAQPTVYWFSKHSVLIKHLSVEIN